MGRHRELKKALERYLGEEVRRRGAARHRPGASRSHWKLQRQAGLAQVPCNDFSLYDHVLDTALMVGVEPERFEDVPEGLDRYFAMARGVAHEGERPASRRSR